jgi:predicted transcriptional regulator of viral defense system
MRIMRFSGKAFTEGIEEHVIEGVPVRVYDPAKTVADCFKYRNKIGLDVALEALRDCRRQRRCTNDDLWQYAKVCRVANVMKPYLEAMLWARNVQALLLLRFTSACWP